jgi:hypothetical protein
MSTNLKVELMLARKDAISLVSISRTMSEFFKEISALLLSLGIRWRSGASALHTVAALRFDFAEILILAL